MSKFSNTADFQTALAEIKQGKTDILDLLQVVEGAEQIEQIELYQAWLDNTPSPIAFAIYFNLAVVLDQQNRPAEAEAAYRKSIEINAAFVQGYFNLGSNLERNERIDEALEEWRKVLAFDYPQLSEEDQKTYLLALNALGRVLENRREFQEAEQMLTYSLLLDPKQPKVISHWVHLRQKQCEWPVYKHIPGVSKKEMIKATSALALLSATNEPEVQLENSLDFVTEKVSIDLPKLVEKTTRYSHKKIRVGYLSSDFRTHAVSLLTVELYELHNRAKFEVYGFCFTPSDNSPLRQRVMSGMDYFISINDMSDEEAAKCIHSHEIDILVDLQGLTSGVRPNILAYRPAPVQVTYLGFPGTTALPCVDYVLADKFLIPEELARFFSEKPLYLPHVFQVSDRQRPVGETPSRESCNLPDDAFVFCVFNNNYKITEEIFACWMRILKRVPDSVLWLLADNEWAQENMQTAAKKQGIAPERLIFASRVMPHDYLARFKVADLFLDCTPFNGGTTSNDALFMGLPILTLSGKTFASRMAGSLLNSFGLTELITYNVKDYEEKAVELANNRAHVAELRKFLENNHDNSHLFDVPQLVRDIETLFEQTLNNTLPAPVFAPPVLKETLIPSGVICLFSGILIRFNNAATPQIQAIYQNQQMQVDILSGDVISTSFERKQERLLLAWLEIHQDDLLANWQLLVNGEMPFVLDGLK